VGVRRGGNGRARHRLSFHARAEKPCLRPSSAREKKFKENIIDHFANGIIKKPQTTFGNVNADVLAPKDMNYVRGNFCSIMLGSAWSS
jgi:hypothetical protein